MIGIDTNVLIRFLVQDDPIQSPVATRFMGRLTRERPGFISAVVLAEVSWVLARAYRASREDVAAAVEGFLGSADLVVENSEAAYRALAKYSHAQAVEFADALIVETARLAGASEVVTFDSGAVSEAGMRLLA
ncbi:MAG: type II toxin-antitoxin system VapC family toxin [Alphaproteobacteria bacterium]|nr:type II toxin-antitoxin system VapC family toxin [Alphaproteobacteria bacterium]